MVERSQKDVVLAKKKNYELIVRWDLVKIWKFVMDGRK